MPTFLTPWQLFDAWNTIEPGSTFFHWPSTSASSVPSFRMSSSSFACLCGGCDASPGFSVVTCISSSSSVSVGWRTTWRDCPTSVFRTGHELQSNTVDFRIAAGFSCA